MWHRVKSPALPGKAQISKYIRAGRPWALELSSSYPCKWPWLDHHTGHPPAHGRRGLCTCPEPTFWSPAGVPCLAVSLLGSGWQAEVFGDAGTSRTKPGGSDSLTCSRYQFRWDSHSITLTQTSPGKPAPAAAACPSCLGTLRSPASSSLDSGRPCLSGNPPPPSLCLSQ